MFIFSNNLNFSKIKNKNNIFNAKLLSYIINISLK